MLCCTIHSSHTVWEGRGAPFPRDKLDRPVPAWRQVTRATLTRLLVFSSRFCTSFVGARDHTETAAHFLYET